MKEEGTKQQKTLRDHCFGCVNFLLPEEAVDYVLNERDLKGDTLLSEVDKKTRDLLKADLYVWVCMGPSKVSSTSDSDNGWSHSDGGHQLTDEDKDRMLRTAQDIYDKYGEELDVYDSVEVHVSSFGVMPCNYNEAGIPLPHIE